MHIHHFCMARPDLSRLGNGKLGTGGAHAALMPLSFPSASVMSVAPLHEFFTHAVVTAMPWLSNVTHWKLSYVRCSLPKNEVGVYARSATLTHTFKDFESFSATHRPQSELLYVFRQIWIALQVNKGIVINVNTVFRHVCHFQLLHEMEEMVLFWRGSKRREVGGGMGGGIMNIYGGLGFHAQAVHNRKLPASTTLKFNHGWNEKEKESWSRQGPSGQFRVKRLWGGPKSNRQGGDLMCHGWKSPLS